mmetsp:Transcript_26715/g.88768  ORF Transcript_26715/g.88768 Transcript_26715/m.88768 type:complete len:348 (-) Transcript_26715:1235-2278(-)
MVVEQSTIVGGLDSPPSPEISMGSRARDQQRVIRGALAGDEPAALLGPRPTAASHPLATATCRCRGGGGGLRRLGNQGSPGAGLLRPWSAKQALRSRAGAAAHPHRRRLHGCRGRSWAVGRRLRSTHARAPGRRLPRRCAARRDGRRRAFAVAAALGVARRRRGGGATAAQGDAGQQTLCLGRLWLLRFRCWLHRLRLRWLGLWQLLLRLRRLLRRWLRSLRCLLRLLLRQLRLLLRLLLRRLLLLRLRNRLLLGRLRRRLLLGLWRLRLVRLRRRWLRLRLPGGGLGGRRLGGSSLRLHRRGVAGCRCCLAWGGRGLRLCNRGRRLTLCLHGRGLGRRLRRGLVTS